MKQIYDTIIVGAGPAGCAAAMFLAEKGIQVLLVDKAEFPRDKVCGDFLTPGTLDVLDRMGVLKKIESANPWKINYMITSAPNGESMKVRIPKHPKFLDYGLVIPRKDLDFIVFEHVCGLKGVDVLENFECTGLLWSKERVSGITGKHEGRDMAVKGRCIIAADGAHSIIAKDIGCANMTDRHTSIAVRAYFENVQGLERAVEVHVDKGMLPGYAWIFPTGEKTANIGAGISSVYKKKKNLKALFDEFLRESKFAKDKLANATMVENSFKGWSLPMGSYPYKRSKGNVLCVGDAASFIDPIMGEGLYYALQGGWLAARAVSKQFTRKRPLTGAGPEYERLWRRNFWWKEFVPGALIRPFMSQPWAVNFTVFSANKWPSKGRTFVAATSHHTTKARLLNPF